MTTTGLRPAWSRSKKNAVSSIVSVPWTTTAPSIVGSSEAPSGRRALISKSVGKLKWLAGVSPRSIATTSAISSSPGDRREDGRAVEGRDVAAGCGVVAHADRAAGEDDRDAGHRPALRSRAAVGGVAVGSPESSPGATCRSPPGSSRRRRAAHALRQSTGATSSSRSSSLVGKSLRRRRSRRRAPSTNRIGSVPTLARVVALGGPQRPAQIDRGDARRPRSGSPRRRARPSSRARSAIGPTTRIGRKLATDTSMFRTPKTRPRTSSGRSSWSWVWDGIATAGVGDAGEERDGDDDRQERRQERQVGQARPGDRRPEEAR